MIETVENQIESKTDLFTMLYLERFPDVAKYISNHGGTLEEARDIFQDAVILYYEKMVTEGFKPQKSDTAYIFGMVRNLWYKRKSQTTYTLSLEGLELENENPDKPVVIDRLVSFLETTGQKCMDILQSFYYERMSMDALAKRFGFASERSATVQKFKCLEKVRDQVKAKSLEYEDFFD